MIYTMNSIYKYNKIKNQTNNKLQSNMLVVIFILN